MINVTQEELLNAGVHFGHLKRKWNPKMAAYIFMERNGIHIIDLNKTHAKMEEAAAAVKQIAKSGKKILFVATKKQAKEIVAAAAKSVNMPYITERWPGGMLTNFATQRKSVKKMTSLDKMLTDGTAAHLSKKERLMMARTKNKMEKLMGSISDLNRLPAALFIVDTVKEHIAVNEAINLGIPTIAINDTNSDPSLIDFPIPANDDASKSVELIMSVMVKAVEEGLAERKVDKEQERERDAANEEEAEDTKMATVTDEEGDAPSAGRGPKSPGSGRPRKAGPRK
ncbi:MAG: 30S ribosomal protein S2 [Bacteroidetes bacterium]|nr:30S ribosomal protein S2 [Bacteroidota bacterium]